MTTNKLIINLDTLPASNYVIPPMVNDVELVWCGNVIYIDLRDMSRWWEWKRIVSHLPSEPCLVNGDKLLVCMLPNMILGAPEFYISLKEFL